MISRNGENEEADGDSLAKERFQAYLLFKLMDKVYPVAMFACPTTVHHIDDKESGRKSNN
jgi:hypothetical protein